MSSYATLPHFNNFRMMIFVAAVAIFTCRVRLFYFSFSISFVFVFFFFLFLLLFWIVCFGALYYTYEIYQIYILNQLKHRAHTMLRRNTKFHILLFTIELAVWISFSFSCITLSRALFRYFVRSNIEYRIVCFFFPMSLPLSIRSSLHFVSDGTKWK